MTDTVFVVLGVPMSALEIAAFLLALGCVACNVREIHWGWPLAIASSALYGGLFAAHRLYGEAWLQAFFAAIALWGWWQWLRGGAGRGPLAVSALGRRGFALALAGWAVAWPALGGLLARTTDSDVPYLDAFPTAGSVLGQVLLARKYVENWWVWLAVNVASVGLFAVRQLWLTALLYALFVVLSGLGLWQWRARLAAAGPA